MAKKKFVKVPVLTYTEPEPTAPAGKSTVQRVILARCAHSDQEVPEVFVYNGHPDDACFEFLFQTLGYTITIVETTDPDLKVRQM